MSQTDERIRAPESAPGFLIHNEGDHVAVAVQDNEPGELQAVYMDSDRVLRVRASEAIPLGHKLALVDLEEGAQVIEYGVPIGLTRRAIKAGELVHIHNIRSARWQKSL
jgi:(2R)-sulfolactate sulfo-lyase subunit alpha